MDQTTDQYLKICEDYQIIAQAIQFVERNFQRQPSLNEIAASIGLSEFHFQRLFTLWAGISPKRFLQYLTKEYAKKMLEESASILEASYSSGLSGPGRLHDLFVATEAVTPGEYKQRGQGLRISYDFYPSLFGECLIARTERGICYLAFVDNQNHSLAFQEVLSHWPNAHFEHRTDLGQELDQSLFLSPGTRSGEKVKLHLQGTNFQLKVWEALLAIPQGSMVSYEDLAKAVGKPGSSRAVGNAVGRNPVPVLIPCHRVIRKVGEFGNYRYGTARKKALLGWEAAHRFIEVTP